MTLSAAERRANASRGRHRGDLLELVFSGITDPVMVLDRQLCVIDCNEAALACLCMVREDVFGKGWASLFPQPEQNSRDKDMTVVLTQGIEWHARIPVLDVINGGSLLFDVKSYPVRKGRRETDPVTHLVVYMHEVTDEVRTYLELVDRNRELQMIKEKLEAKADQLDRANRVLADNNTELKGENSRLSEIALVDVMTGLPNFRSFNERLHAELKHSVMTDRPLSLLLFDVDNFKQYNDQFGHPQGDELLRQMAMLVRDNVRSSDFPARYGGEEFAVLLPRTDKFGAVVVAERLRTRVETYPMPNRKTTISIGVAEFPSDTKGIDDLINRADKAMYAAKSYGKNTSCLWTRDRNAEMRRVGQRTETLYDGDCVPVQSFNSANRRAERRVLLVDKDELLLVTLRDELQEYGYQVTTASSGRSALVKLAEASGTFDVMITELVLPDRTGFELKEQALALHPHLPVIYLSAIQTNMKQRSAFDDSIHHITKPVEVDDVVALLNLVIGAPRRDGSSAQAAA